MRRSAKIRYEGKIIGEIALPFCTHSSCEGDITVGGLERDNSASAEIFLLITSPRHGMLWGKEKAAVIAAINDQEFLEDFKDFL